MKTTFFILLFLLAGCAGPYRYRYYNFYLSEQLGAAQDATHLCIIGIDTTIFTHSAEAYRADQILLGRGRYYKSILGKSVK